MNKKSLGRGLSSLLSDTDLRFNNDDNNKAVEKNEELIILTKLSRIFN